MRFVTLYPRAKNVQLVKDMGLIPYYIRTLFKAYMDRDVTATKHNSQYMVLNAFDIMLKMEKNPDKYLKLFEHESGNDIVNK